MLDAVQRSVALKACRAHCTVFLHSALILSRLFPIDIKARKVAGLYEVKRGKDLRDTFVDRELEKPSGIYADGSWIEGKVCAALTEWGDGKETWYSTLRLDPFCTIFQAELVALKIAIRRVKKGELARRVTLIKKTGADYYKFSRSYAKKVIRAASLEE
ncbi:hypothetical protein EVAR_7057_1 [Eumeta japonica]|uniref:RNase H type-1 domain-containing protein n=1 Tax=Eumeta variegata TaxID=151549 RepID=A0A4C1XC99_EUMVA|nr:hypothetical protein EVAR_7057_1 [Eumeta japonica]